MKFGWDVGCQRAWCGLLALFLLLSFFIGAGHQPVVQAASYLSLPTGQEVPRFVPSSCAFDIPVGLVEGQEIDCGFLVVPEEYGNPSGGTIELAVAILYSKSPTPEPDPLVVLQGGPGGSTIETYLQAIPMSDRFWADRDIVLFDQRGTLYSRPALDCPEFFDLMIDTLAEDISDEEDIRLSLAAVDACRERLVDEGVDLNAYDSVENAADIDSLRIALGYDSINLYGVSYGSLLAQHVMRFHPEGLRSVILDAVVPPQVNFNLNAPRTMNRAFEEVFSTCAQDDDCGAAFPELRQVFYQQVDRLNENPVMIQLTDFETGQTYPALLDGEVFMSGIFQMLYATEVIPFLPKVIYDARVDDFVFFSRIFSLFTFDRSILFGMYYSVQCAEEANFNLDDYDLSGLPDQIQEMEDISAAYFLQACDVWNVEELPPVVDEPVSSDIPTLILSGQFDPITPPEYGEMVAERLSNAYVYVFPDGGHGAALSGECQDQVILDFLLEPTTPPSAACIEEAGLVFVTPGELVRLPVLPKLLNFEDGTGWQALIYLLSLLFLLTSLLVYPIVWLVRLIRRKPAVVETIRSDELAFSTEQGFEPPVRSTRTRPALYRLAPWLSALAALTLLVFTIVFIVVVVNMVTNNDMRLLSGLPGAARPMFILPVVTVVLFILMIAGGLSGWIRRAGSLAGRLYFSLLTLATFACVVILADWGMLMAVLPF